MKFSDLRIKSTVRFEFHVSRNARVKYDFDKSLFSITGDLIVANFYQARILSEKINNKRKEEGNTKLVTPGQINSLGLLHEIFHYILRYYEEKENPAVFSRGINHLKNNLGDDELNKILLEYINEFPPLDVYNGKILPNEYLNASTSGKSNKEIIFEELILLNLENSNPATVSLEELYSDKPLAQKTNYINFIDETEKFFVTEKPFGNENLPLLQFLKKPLKSNPYNIEGQLDYILNSWGVFVYQPFHDKILGGKDLIHEDYKLFVHHGGGEKATPPVPQYKFDREFFEQLKIKVAQGEQLTADEEQFFYAETEQFTEDIDWMPKVVMLAKNTYVWLDQLSKKYQREIKKLNEIPDEELDNLSRWNFTALWLIGIWERSSASKKVKHLTGNPEAVSSAYSLYDYVIADEIGGEDAFQNLKDRCWKRGIRLSSDMVPNHTGIYSKWVIEKPDYFIQTNRPPYPGYSFNGPNLSDDSRVEVRIEDKYYSRTDAAVVFQRRDSYTGDTCYIYHGNDGTHMPWNDTAQLNLLIPEVRESLIQTIMHVARKTPIIRFDAAMTLAKKHFQRLWFPQPGTGGAVPSRSDSAMTRDAFDAVMPVEFWREVVDRINTEMPQTLLLAEAFWLMESYFVRTLGMHRVYNSAFMHMTMKEENQKYRELIKNTLEFNPEILKRYVNFMSNPDEETAVNQFGKGDKYFGICMLMVTMPGLPMFAHGQVEGFSEKYGMEYKKAYYNEFVDENLIKRHEAEIFPLARKRYMFSQVYNFELYDFIDNHGEVKENVFAYSNRYGDERSVVIFNNSYEECHGIINISSPRASSNGSLFSNKIGDALALKHDNMFFYIYKDHKSNLEYISGGKQIHEDGLFTALSGYEYRLYLDFREVFDEHGHFRQITEHLNGKGVPSIDHSLKEMQLVTAHNALRKLFSTKNFEIYNNYITEDVDKKEGSPAKKLLLDDISNFIHEFNNVTIPPVDKDIVLSKIDDELTALKEFRQIWKENTKKPQTKQPKWISDLPELNTFLNNGKEKLEVLLPVIVFKNLSTGWLTPGVENNKDIFDKLIADDILFTSLKLQNHPSPEIHNEIQLLKVLGNGEEIYQSGKVVLKETFPDEAPKRTTKGGKPKKRTREEYFIKKVFRASEANNFLRLNEYEGSYYYHKESFENLLNWIYVVAMIEEANKYLVQKELKQKRVRKTVSKEVTSSVSKGKLNEKNNEAEKQFITILKTESGFYKKIIAWSDQAGYKLEVLKEFSEEIKSKTVKAVSAKKAVNLPKARKQKIIKTKPINKKRKDE